MNIKVERVVYNVRGKNLEFNETLFYDDNGVEVYNRAIEMYNDLKLYEEYERVTGERLLSDRDYLATLRIDGE